MTEMERDAAILATHEFDDLTAVLTEAARQLTLIAEKMQAAGGRVGHVPMRTEHVEQLVRESLSSLRWFGYEDLVSRKTEKCLVDWHANTVLERRMNQVLGKPELSAKAQQVVDQHEEYQHG